MPTSFRFPLALLVLVCALAAPSAQALISTNVEPIIGYERVQKLVPTPRTKDRLVYGGRLTVGLPLISMEAEYIRGADTESDPISSTTFADTDDKARVGLRSSIRLLGIISFIARGGAQASRNTNERTTAGVTTKTVGPIRYRPYAGAGLKAKLGRNVSFTADISTVFNNFPNLNDNEYMTTAGLAISFP